MTTHRGAPSALLTLVTLLLAVAASAEQSQRFGEYTVHYNALTTDLLVPDVARQYSITRSRSRVLLNVTVLRDVMGNPAEPVAASVAATATNLSAQLRTIDMREVRDGPAIYYIGDFPVANREMLDFKVTVSPEDGARHVVQFRQQFFTE